MEAAYFSKLYYHTKFRDVKLRGGSVAPQVSTAVMLVLEY
jgi:hypothetical protein